MSNETSSATIDAPAGGGAGSSAEDNEAGMSGAEFCSVATSCGADLADQPVCQQPPEGRMPTVYPTPNDPPLNQTLADKLVIDIAAGFVTGGFSLGKAGVQALWFKTPLLFTSVAKTVIPNTVKETVVAAPASQAIDKVWEWAVSAPEGVDGPDASVPDASLGDLTGAQNPGQDGGTEIGVADPGENSGTTGVYAGNLGPGPDGPADPGEGTGSGGVYVRPVSAGPDGPADPGENSGGGGGYVRPVGAGTSDGPADPGEGGGGVGGAGGGAGGSGGGGGGELHVGGGHGDAGPVKAE